MQLSLDQAVNGVVTVVAAGIYTYVARLMWRRQLAGDARLASRMFGVFWGALAVLYGLSALSLIPRALGVDDLALSVTLVYVLLLLIVVALWGLLYYLLFVYTGQRRLFLPVTIAYSLLAIATIYLITWLHPIATDAVAGLKYQNQLGPGASIAFGALFTLPALAAVGMYATLYFRATGRSERFRIGLVSLSFFVWFGWSFVSNILQLAQRYPGAPALRIVSQVFSLAVPTLVLVAYRPPRVVRRRLGVQAVDSDPQEA